MITSVLLLSCDCTQHETKLFQRNNNILQLGNVRSHIHGSNLHLVLVEVLLDDLVSPGHLPQET